MTRKETEIDIYEPEKMEDILKELEFYPASCRVKKTRCYYIKDHMTAAADKVENLGNFLELEIIVAKEEERAGGLDMIYELMRMLGCEKTRSYCKDYLGVTKDEFVPWAMVRLCWSSVCDTAIAQMHWHERLYHIIICTKSQSFQLVLIFSTGS